MMTARVTVCQRADGSFEIYINEAGRDLIVKELQGLDKRWDHFHLDHFDDPEMAFGTDVPLSAVAYNEGDKVFKTGKVLLRPDDWDAEYFPHVLAPGSPPAP
ncbi:hypothetical protein [Terricaulis sp.]|uniref:hypothetical protein n=1 Tax=Terricaulis sp. TaxID=2768686 RepID=UPI003782DCDE